MSPNSTDIRWPSDCRYNVCLHASDCRCDVGTYVSMSLLTAVSLHAAVMCVSHLYRPPLRSDCRCARFRMSVGGFQHGQHAGEAAVCLHAGAGLSGTPISRDHNGRSVSSHGLPVI